LVSSGSVVSSGITSRTVKFVTLQTVTPFTVTQIGPEIAPSGTVVVIMLELDAFTSAGVPPNVMRFFDSSESKFKPITLTRSPT